MRLREAILKAALTQAKLRLIIVRGLFNQRVAVDRMPASTTVIYVAIASSYGLKD
jgi:hypothetical protein